MTIKKDVIVLIRSESMKEFLYLNFHKPNTFIENLHQNSPHRSHGTLCIDLILLCLDGYHIRVSVKLQTLRHTSYLKHRTQIIKIGDTHSNSHAIKCDVPQGSTLSSLFFLICVNDMRPAISCNILLYSDDSAPLTSNKSAEEIERFLSVELE